MPSARRCCSTSRGRCSTGAWWTTRSRQAPSLPALDKAIAIETHDKAHPLGHKGIGESGVTPAAAAIACAVLDAIGRPVATLPLTPERVLAVLEAEPGA